MTDTTPQAALLLTENQKLREALKKIAALGGEWGPFPETKPEWAGMAIVTAREALSLPTQAEPVEGGEVVDWEHIARLLDAALQELIVFVDERWGDNECRPLENAKHALGLIKED